MRRKILRAFNLCVFIIPFGTLLVFLFDVTRSLLPGQLHSDFTDDVTKPMHGSLIRDVSDMPIDKKEEAPKKTIATTDPMSERMAKIHDQCERLKNTSYLSNMRPTGKVWTYAPLRLGYCVTPKVGCTFWKRIMRYIGFDYNKDKDIQQPSDIDRGFVHYGAVKNIRVDPVRNKTAMGNNKLFMFAREPFSRLWSAYIDKFLLPDFWRTDAKAVIKNARKNASETELLCANNVTFEEFLSFVVFAGNKGGFNEHWEPSNRICNPCHATFEMIGKQETFARDTNIILSRFGFGHLASNETKLDRARSEIAMLVDYNLKLENSYKKICYDVMDVAKRLWLAFQLNGHISRLRPFPSQELEAANFTLAKKPQKIQIYTNLLTKVLSDQTEDEWKTIQLQKRQMMIEAYKTIPVDVIISIRELYTFDFSLFDYNSCPVDMFDFCKSGSGPQ